MRIFKFRDVTTPQRATTGAAGIDFFVPNDYTGSTIVDPHTGIKIPSGIKADIPEGYMLVELNKSGIALKYNMIVGAQVCDDDYVGEIHIHLINCGLAPVEIHPGQKLAQFALVPILKSVIEVVATEEELFGSKIATSERGVGAFGSTG